VSPKPLDVINLILKKLITFKKKMSLADKSIEIISSIFTFLEAPSE